MDQSTVSNPVALAQSSIRSFFQPRAPIYSAPPSSTKSTANNCSTSSPVLEVKNTSTESTKSSLPLKPSNSHTNTHLPAQARISTINEKYVQPLTRINSLLLPVNYPDSFYHKILDPSTSPNYSRVILWQDKGETEPKVIGGIVCRLDRDEITKSSSIYIQSLALLSPYRSYGLATALLDTIISSFVSEPLKEFPITSLYAHVWTENSDGLQWYAARRFTQEKPVIQGYYRRLKPNTAWIVRRNIVPSDHLRHSQTTSPSAPPAAIQESSSPTLLSPQPNKPSQPTRPMTFNPLTRTTSFQNTRPETEWNDLPEDILLPPSRTGTPHSGRASSISAADIGNGSGNGNDSASGPPSSATSRSSSRNGLPGAAARKKRQYPAAAFGAASANGAKTPDAMS